MLDFNRFLPSSQNTSYRVLVILRALNADPDPDTISTRTNYSIVNKSTPVDYSQIVRAWFEVGYRTGRKSKVISKKFSTKADFISAYESDAVDRIIVIAHGPEKSAGFQMMDGFINLSTFINIKKGSQLKEIDILACHQKKWVNQWKVDMKVNTVKTFNPDGGFMMAWWFKNEMKTALNILIPNHIRSLNY